MAGRRGAAAAARKSLAPSRPSRSDRRRRPRHPEPVRLRGPGREPRARIRQGWARWRPVGRSAGWIAERFVGIDVSAAPSTWRSCPRAGLAGRQRSGRPRRLVGQLSALAPRLVVLEASGGYETAGLRRAGRWPACRWWRQPAPGARLRARHRPTGQDRRLDAPCWPATPTGAAGGPAPCPRRGAGAEGAGGAAARPGRMRAADSSGCGTRPAGARRHPAHLAWLGERMAALDAADRRG